MTELTALPGLPIGASGFRRDQHVRVIYDGESALFLAVVIPDSGAEPFAKLWPFTGGGYRHVRISQVAQYDGRAG